VVVDNASRFHARAHPTDVSAADKAVVGRVVVGSVSRMSNARCPRCQQTLGESDVGAGVLRCVGCGCFVCTPVAAGHLRRFLVVDDGVWAEVLAHGGRGPPCPDCATGMKVANLKGVVVDGCPACGSLLLDPGELQRLTGRDEPPLPTSPSPSSSSSSSSVAPVEDDSDLEPLPGRVFAPPIEALGHFLGTTSWVQLSQLRQHNTGLTFTIDQGARYVVRTPSGSGVLRRQESAGALLARMFLAPFRRQRFELLDARETPMLILERHFEKVIMSRLDVFLDDGAGDPGRLLGVVERNFSLLDSRYELKDAAGHVFARLIRPTMSLWQFRLETADGVASGAVAKQWSGLVTEWLSDADDFGVDFGPHPWTREQRGVIVAAALSIDLDLFERGNTSRRTTIFDDLLQATT